ncbi:MAG: DUF2177 family protein [Afipia sp.]|nr:DUF2177 family protein [Afipia sp.]
MLRFITAYAATAAVFLAADFIWLTRTIGFYRSALGDLLADRPNLVAAGALYSIYFVGIVVFAVLPSVKTGSWISAVLLGALLGLVSFSTYDLTNLATLSRWPLNVVIVDMIWGTFVTALASLAGFVAIQTFAPIE